MSRTRNQLPPKQFTFNIDILQKKYQIEQLKPREIQPRKNNSFHTSTSDHNQSFYNKSFDRSINEVDCPQKVFQNEFSQLKQLISKGKSQLEREQRSIIDDIYQTSIKSEVQIPKQVTKKRDQPKEQIVDLNYYQTFKPIFEKLNNLVEQSNLQNEDQIKNKLTTIFDSIEMESQRSEKPKDKPDQIAQLVESLMREFIVPQQQQQQQQQQQYQQQYIQKIHNINNQNTQNKERSSNINVNNKEENQIQQESIPIQQIKREYRKIKINFKELDILLHDLKINTNCNDECGYMKFLIEDKVVFTEHITNFNISKKQSLKLEDIHFEPEQTIGVPLKIFKLCLSTQQCQIHNNEIVLLPLIIDKQMQLIFLFKNILLSDCQLQQDLLLEQMKNKQIQKEFAFIRLQQSINKIIKWKMHLLFKNLQQNIIKNQKLNIICQKLIKRRFLQQSNIKLRQQFSKLLLISAKQIIINRNSNCLILSQLLNKYSMKLKSQTLRALTTNDDQMIMLQSFQSEQTLDSYLAAINILLGDKVVVVILNTEVQTITTFITDFGIVQEYVEQINDLSQFETLFDLTQNIHQELINQGINFEFRHIWQVQNDLFIITLSNMKTHYLSKLALLITNGIMTLRQRYLNLFQLMRCLKVKSEQSIKQRYFNQWNFNRNQDIQKYRTELQQLKEDNDIQNRGTCQLQIENQALHIQNEMKSKCLSSALLENTLSKMETAYKLKKHFFAHWLLKAKEVQHYQARLRSAFYLMGIFQEKYSLNLQVWAFREIALSSYGQMQQQPVSPQKQTKRSNFTREPTRRSQEDLEQSVLWDVHQMKLQTPNTHNISIMTANQSLSPNQTLNASLLLNETDPIYAYHSQRTNKQKHKKQAKFDQENQQNQNKIYSQRTKDFVRKLSQSKKHQRFNSTQQPGSSFSFYDKLETLN